MGKSSGNHSRRNIKFILGLIHLSMYFLFAFSFSLMPLSFMPRLLFLACFDNYYAYCKDCFFTISTVWDNGRFILGEEGYGQPWWSALPRCPDRRQRLPISPGTASLPKGGCCAAASRLVLRAQCTEGAAVHCSSPALLITVRCVSCRRTFLPLLLVAVLSTLSQNERPVPQGEVEACLPSSLFLSLTFCSHWSTFYKWYKLCSDRFSCMVVSLIRL